MYLVVTVINTLKVLNTEYICLHNTYIVWTFTFTHCRHYPNTTSLGPIC